LLTAAGEDYQVASDGSRQVKVKVMCPQCRDDYKHDDYTAKQIVRACLLLRRAASLEPLLTTAQDSELSASELSQRHVFVRDVSLSDLQEAQRILTSYQSVIKDKECEPVKEPAWDVWKDRLQESSSHSSHEQKSDPVPWRDPTLFAGLEVFMYVEEQQFLTKLLTSGDAASLAQAADILQGVLQVSSSRQAVQTLSELSNFSISGSTPSKKAVEELQRIKKRFPLPRTMPRSVSLPTYDPDGGKKLLHFKKGTLSLSAVRGPAGKVGLRVGDVVTHVNGTEVTTKEECHAALLSAAAASSAEAAAANATMQIVVNANAETAASLKQRAADMKNKGIVFP
jgi:hypothetical protein